MRRWASRCDHDADDVPSRYSESAAGYGAFQKVYLVAAVLAATGATIARRVPDEEAMSGVHRTDLLTEAPNTA